MGRKFWIVWNEAKNEGFITDDEDDAIACEARAAGLRQAITSTVGEAFAEAYEDDELSIEEVELPCT